MKCPKCGYHSFDYLTNCRKCNNDLATFKSKFRLRSLIFPHRLNSAMAQPEPEAPQVAAPPTLAASTATASTDFGFDFMEEEPTPVQSKKPETAPPAPSQPASRPAIAIQPDLPDDAFAEKDEMVRNSLPTDEEPFEESEPDDTFGLDFSWDTDLPALDEGQFVEEELVETAETGSSSEWNVEETSPPRRKPVQQDAQETPRRPFELRGTGANSPSPSLLNRCLALGVDLSILIAATLLFLAAGQSALAPDGPHRLLPSPKELLSLAIPYFLVFFSVCFGYFTLFHFFAGQTPGKMLLRLQVETESGQPLLFSQAFLRSVGGLFSMLLFGLGFFALLFDPRRRGWNDRLAGTVVANTLPGAGEKQPESDGP